jgi:secreted PhoX family phosphatase
MGFGRRSFLGIFSAAASAALAGVALGAMSADTARRAVQPARAFNPALLCRPQTTAALQARATQRVPSRREP